MLCWDCRVHLKKTNELPPLTAPAAGGAIPGTGVKEPIPIKDGKEANVKENMNKECKDSKMEKEGKDPAYLFRPVAESPDASPQRMRTRNKAAKEQSSNRARPKRGEAETPEPKTPSKHSLNSNSPSEKSSSNTPPTPIKNKKGKSEKSETPLKNRKRTQEKCEEPEIEEKELGLFKKKRERAEVSCFFLYDGRDGFFDLYI